ncbi:MAG: low temperature requirement protein A [Mycobacterium sp.]|nr:low temperature requirement protein A [Mycobacterium sp.]
MKWLWAESCVISITRGMVMMARRGSDTLRDRGERAEVSVVELFFDLVYVFAVIQLSHALLQDLSTLNALHTVVLWFAVWLGWQYTCWVTNWFGPDTPAIRSMLFALMGVVLVMAAAIPHAFDHRAVIFAGAFVSLQVGRTVFVLLTVGRDHELSPNFTRMLAWLLVSAALWVSGAFTEDWVRLSLWGAAVLVEYLAPMIGFAFPLLGRSSTREWTIDGGHLAERCRLFVIVAFGETILSTGAQLSDQPQWSAPILIAAAVAFGGVVAAWWIYSVQQRRRQCPSSPDPTIPGASAKFHYTHVVLVGGIIVCAVANAPVLADPAAELTVQAIAVLVGGARDLPAGQSDLPPRGLPGDCVQPCRRPGRPRGTRCPRAADRPLDDRRPDPGRPCHRCRGADADAKPSPQSHRLGHPKAVTRARYDPLPASP